MQWLELGKLVAKLGSPLLGAIVAGTPSAAVIGEIAKEFELNASSDSSSSASNITNAINSDSDKQAKLARIEQVIMTFINDIAPDALTRLIQKLL
jgi:hypothetical protein